MNNQTKKKMQPKYLKNLLLLFLISHTWILQAQDNEAYKVLAIKNVNIIPMTLENQIIKHATVVIEGNKITSINKPVPSSAHIIEGKGKWLIPGLIDMHLHAFASIDFGA